jgi:hypothetical protein
MFLAKYYIRKLIIGSAAAPVVTRDTARLQIDGELLAMVEPRVQQS